MNHKASNTHTFWHIAPILAIVLSCYAFGQTNLAHMLSGVNYQPLPGPPPGPYTFVPADATRTVVFASAAPQIANLPSGLNANFGAGHMFIIINQGPGQVTINCTGCTIGGSPSLVLAAGESTELYSDGQNYVAALGGGGGTGSGLPTLPTSPNGIPQLITSTPSGGVGQPAVWSLPGLSSRNVTAGTDTILPTDCSPQQVVYRTSGTVAETLPTAATLGVPSCFLTLFIPPNSATTTVTVTPVTWTVNGAASISFSKGQSLSLSIDPASATNWLGSLSSAVSNASINVSDYGVDCTGSTASDTAITNAIAAGPHIVIPQNCIVRFSSNHTYTSATIFEFKKGGIFKPDAAVTITLGTPPIAGPTQQIFDISNSGSWIIPATGDVQIPWYGTDCSETTDAAPILNVMTGTQDRFSGRTLVGPDNCHLVVESTWIIKNQESLTVRTNKFPGVNQAFSVSGRTSGTIIAPINKDVGIPLSRAGWTASADSENTESPSSDGFPAQLASNVLTSPPATTCTTSSCSIWVTCYIGSNCASTPFADPLPHYIRIDMGSAQTIAQVAYMPRQDSAIGRPLAYDIQTSTNASCASGAGFSSQTTGTWDGSPVTKVANFTPVSARCFEVIASSTISGIYMSAANINASTAVPPAWTATADSAESGHPASFLIDGVYDDPTTYDRYWSTAFSGSPGLPHYVIIDMQSAQTVAGIAYTPRQALATTGFILGYDVQTSTNAGCAGNVGFSSQTTGTWTWDYTTKTATFAPVSARCVKLVATSSSGGNTAAGKSLQIYGATGVPQADAGPVILLSRSGYADLKGFTVQAQANGVQSNFSGSIQTLNYSHGPLAGGFTSTHNTFEDLYLVTNLQGSSVNNYKGFYIHNDPNQELFTFKNMQVNCQNGYYSYGFISDDPNADSNYLQNSIINNCMRAVGMIGGVSYIHGGNYSTNGGFSAFGAGGAVIYEIGAGCVAEMSDTVEAEGTGQILSTGKDQVGGGCNNAEQNFHDNQLTTPDIDPAVYPINFVGGGNLVLCHNAMLSTGATVHNSTLVGTDQVGLFGAIGRLYDCGDNFMTAPNVLSKVPFGGKGEYHVRLSNSTVANQGYSTYPHKLIPATGPANGARAVPSPWLDFSGNIFNSIPSTPKQETFTIATAPAADGIHSTFSFTEKGVNGGIGGAHMYAFDAPLSGIQIASVTQPAMDALTVLGTPGSTNYGYKIECLAGSGHCAASTEVTTATGPATLGSPANSCILVNWRPAGGVGNVGAGAWGYKLFRTTCGGAGVCGTNPTGLVYTATNRDLDGAGNYGFTDCGTVADGSTPDVDNSTGELTSTQGTITANAPFLSHTATWNAAGSAFTDFISNITCTAAATASVAAGFGTSGTQWQLKYAAANCATPQILSPDGAAANPAYSFSAQNNMGMFRAGTDALRLTTAGDGSNHTTIALIDGTGIYVGTTAFIVGTGVAPSRIGMASGIAFGWSNNTANPALALDTALSRKAAGFMTVGTGAQGSVAGFIQGANTKATAADVTCGTGGTISDCSAATTITGLSFTLPLSAVNWSMDCYLVVGQATATTANQWLIQTATNGATNTIASYDMATAATAMAVGAITGQGATTTAFQITPSWTLGAIGTKMPAHIHAYFEGVSVSGTVINVQVIAPTVADLLTIYRGSSCSLHP